MPQGALLIQDEEGAPTLILFTALERAKEFIGHFPGLGGVLTEFKGMLFQRVLEKIDQDLSIVINLGLDFEPELGFRTRARISASTWSRRTSPN